MPQDPNALRALIGRFDRALYGDLLDQFGPPGPDTDEYLAQITGSTVKEVRGAHHNARNDSGIRPPKPDVDNR
jgi:hypothetical protein